MALGGSGHADTINTYPTCAACFADLRDHAVRLMKRRGRHGLRRCCDGQCKDNGYEPDHSFLRCELREQTFLDEYINSAIADSVQDGRMILNRNYERSRVFCATGPAPVRAGASPASYIRPIEESYSPLTKPQTPSLGLRLYQRRIGVYSLVPVVRTYKAPASLLIRLSGSHRAAGFLLARRNGPANLPEV